MNPSDSSVTDIDAGMVQQWAAAGEGESQEFKATSGQRDEAATKPIVTNQTESSHLFQLTLE